MKTLEIPFLQINYLREKSPRVAKDRVRQQQSLETAAKQTRRSWLAEGGCLHDFEDWKDGGIFDGRALKEALLRFYKVNIGRKLCTKPGFTTWRQVLDSFGSASYVPEIRKLAEEAKYKLFTP